MQKTAMKKDQNICTLISFAPNVLSFAHKNLHQSLILPYLILYYLVLPCLILCLPFLNYHSDIFPLWVTVWKV